MVNHYEAPMNTIPDQLRAFFGLRAGRVLAAVEAAGAKERD